MGQPTAMRILYTLLVSVFSISVLSVSAQKKLPFPKFGKITPAHLDKKIYSIDSHAKAVVLQDYGEVSVEGNSKGWFSLLIKRHRIVHILNNNGYNLADVEIPLFRNDNGDEEKVVNLKAVTYNLSGGKIVETKLEKSGIFSENVSKSKVVKKFTMPNVKEGCIIEYEYQVTSDYLRAVDPWIFQESVPVLWSEFLFSVPAFFTFAPMMKGYLPLDFTEKRERQVAFTIRDATGAGAASNVSFTAQVEDVRWVMTNVPALETEKFTSSLKNHLSRIEFHLLGQSDPLRPYSYQKSWGELTRQLQEAEEFGAGLKSRNLVSDELKPLFASISNEEEKAKKIFYYVRDNFTSMGNAGIYMSESMKNILKNKKGYVADINLVLTGMLRSSNLNASPVILSTTSNGFVFEAYPNLRGFNYVVVQLKIGGKTYMLDASRPTMGFNFILPMCYNGMARVISDEMSEINLNSNSLQERSTTMIMMVNNEKGKWEGKFTHTPGMFGSYETRGKIAEKGRDAYFKEVEKGFGMEVNIFEPTIDSLKAYDHPLNIQYNFTVDPNEDLLYINPMFTEGWKTNPFTSLKRSYPVEMPYTIDETVLLTMEIPKGYEIDELPKQMMVKYDESGASFFEYRISTSENMISFRSRLKLAKSFFMPDEYELLREFFSLVVKKHNEQIVFKKKK